MNQTKTRSLLSLVLRQLLLVGTFGILDVWLRYKTRSIGLYSITELAPNLLTLMWAVLLSSVVTLIPSRKWGRIAYGICYYFYMIYTIVQFGVYLVLDRFVYVTDLFLAGEGADYADWVLEFVTPSLICQLLALVGFGVLGILFFPKKPELPKKVALVRGIAALMAVLGISQAGSLYGELAGENVWDNFQSPAFEYKRFVSPNFGMQITGVYQFLCRDLQVQLDRAFADTSALSAEIDAYFEEKPDHVGNEYTGILEGKNVIAVMLESIDDWLITPEVMPTLHGMMEGGINFTNLYTPDYASGYTFNTEFAFNLGVYPYSNGNVSYALTRSAFPHSIANMFAAEGYNANSFHEGEPDFYNRGPMHTAFGFEIYHCYRDYPLMGVSVHDDTFLPKNDVLWEAMTGSEPFYSFVITYTAHLPYAQDDFTVWARNQFPEYNGYGEELSGLYAKARITDEMFRLMLERLEAEGKLDNTVFVCFTDHYAYGIQDAELLQQKSEEAGSAILEKTPAFIWWPGCEGVQIDKVCQTVDLAPTVMNLFGMEVPKNLMGSDILDDSYEGYAIFPYTTWVKDGTYVKYGEVQWNESMTEEEIQQMNAFVQRYYYINDAILEADYYANK
ncbi:MAG: sulfatase-like hydrolase/transferase [Oscillospiraceae bacterium]|nr:sulfatase-like hydrolase/transferase [Oscillospiraceae bacterium]